MPFSIMRKTPQVQSFGLHAVYIFLNNVIMTFMKKYGRETYVRKSYKKEDIAYFSGIVDGEGSISIGNYATSRIGTPQFTTYLSVCNTSKVLVDWLHERFGSKPVLYTLNQLPKNSRLPVWRWQVTGDRLLHLCELILPYSVIKKREIEIMIKMRKTFIKRGYKIGSRGPILSKELLDYRFSLAKELKSLHVRCYSNK